MLTTRRTRLAALALAAVAALTLGGAGAAQAKPPGTPAIPLDNEQETGEVTGGAHGFFSYEIDGGMLCYTLTAEGLTTPAVAAHIHVAPRNVNGPVVVPLVVEGSTEFSVTECTTASDALLDAISASPRAYYVNVHTTRYPGGEIRGQLK
ncbi:CHRD domain-containing protein [Agromyces sp. NPDC058104]|uniref:CHRD domain-containing protein n=1 Tax=Agromyces sp. NPDC058104 TaxID=3346342 RepID=UPI0036DF6201